MVIGQQRRQPDLSLAVGSAIIVGVPQFEPMSAVVPPEIWSDRERNR